MLPQAVGLYDPRFESDNCGIGFVGHLSGQATHEVIERALDSLCNLEHRGAMGGDGASGDGAGLLLQIPKKFFAKHFESRGRVAVGVCFMPQDEGARRACVGAVADALRAYGLKHFDWRPVPLKSELLGAQARKTCPVIQHLLIAMPSGWAPPEAERALYLVRKRAEAEIVARAIVPEDQVFYVASLSTRTMVYKGLMLASQLGQFYPDLQHPDFQSAVAVFHQRYSTNTFPTWTRAQPFRLLCHNGEINTIAGNVNWTRARQGTLDQSVWGADGEGLTPIVDTDGSDSSMLDNVAELLTRSGRDLAHALLMMVPEAWEGRPDLDPDRRAFFAYHAGLSEPWDGPAALTFCDGRVAGTILDRNGLRPARYTLTQDGWVASASEEGAVRFDEGQVEARGKLEPGQILLADFERQVVWEDAQVKAHYAKRRPYAAWLDEHAQAVPQVPVGDRPSLPDEALSKWQRAFGYSAEDVSMILRPMGNTGHEPVGSMGDDTPPAALSVKARPLYQFFKQRFAQVTNPAIDSLREARVMSLQVRLGTRPSYLNETPEHARLLVLDSPILHRAGLRVLREKARQAGLKTVTLPTLFSAENPGRPPTGLRRALETLAQDAERAVCHGAELIVLSDRLHDQFQAPIPALLALGAVHQHLIETGLRTQTSLIVECGDAREIHHIACLIGCGAEAVYPYLALASVRALARAGKIQCEPVTAVERTINAFEKGLLKTMAKMGIATVAGYHGAQVFETIGFHREVIDGCFRGIPTRPGQVDFDKIATSVLHHHRFAYGEGGPLPNVGLYRFKPDGERHAFTPQSVRTLHQAVGEGARAFERDAQVDEAVAGAAFEQAYALYQAYAEPLSQCGDKGQPLAIRDLLAFHSDCEPIPLQEVEPVSAVLQRFSSGAMSHGSLGDEAHRALALAMNRLGAASNSGEGGEHPERFATLENSRIKQIASGRFGVTVEYLSSADELQIKIAQGAKPGEGGQLPGHKVSMEIATIRHTTPGVALISPPPHHDIYSIEDLAQLIYDLKQVNPRAKVSVKLVAETGVGIVAAGVVKGYADVVHIAGHAGGTGSSPLNSIKNAGEPWELGLAETQQTLMLNDLRGRVRLRTDGGLQTGRDVLIAAMLGADEVSFGTASLVALGCLMARQCHANTCPVGIATQDLKLRKKFLGKPEALMAYMCFIAQDVRVRLAKLGYRALGEVVGRVDLLRSLEAPGQAAIDLTPLLTDVDPEGARDRCAKQPRNELPKQRTLDHQVFRDARDAINGGGIARLRYNIANTDRSVGVRLAGAAALCEGAHGLPKGSVECTFKGSAGGSFGAFTPGGIKLVLHGVANDYVGKGLCGGRIVVAPDSRCRYRDRAHQHAILGNTVLYGATGGWLFAAGRAGERFAVRNSGATAVVEGVGAHGCEYMTGGTVVVLGRVGDNFAAGMTGGTAYVFDEDGELAARYNPELVKLSPVTGGDAQFLIDLVQQHMEETRSARAAWLLEQWVDVLPQFVKVSPLEEAAQIEAGNEGAQGRG